MGLLSLATTSKQKVLLIEQAHQKTIKEKMAVEDSWNLFGKWWEKIDINIKKAEVKEIDIRTATNLINRYEWLQCMPAMVKYCFGIYFEGNLGGAVVYSTEYSENLGHWDKFDYTGKMILLSRGACVHWSHPHSASKLITSSMKMLPKKYKIVTATTDPQAGEIGTIYQACNFDYIGSMRENNPNVDSRVNDRFGVKINNKLYGSRSIRQKFGTQKKDEILQRYPNAEFIPQASKSRYFYFLGTKKEKKYYRDKIKQFIKPYPKR
tara:strand:+ start:1354 stop:2148 length:795 start_codon:yes stop_codon:yes gene_type:complete